MAQNSTTINNNNNNKSTALQAASNDNCYQISDDDLEDCEDLGDDCLLDENAHSLNGCRGPYERAWTTEATRALIHIRGPMEGSFTEGRQKRTALWLHCTRQLQKLGFRYSAAKVQKKWHNILITYNKNLAKKYVAGYVHWEFFEEMFKYLQGKKADCEMQKPKHEQIQFKVQPDQMQPLQPTSVKEQQQPLLADESKHMTATTTATMLNAESKSNDEFDEDSNTDTSDIKQPKLEFETEHHHAGQLPLEISHDNELFEDASTNGHEQEDFENAFQSELDASWWKDYFERKLQVEREKIELQKEMHRELMQINKLSMVQQERMERIKVDAINSLTATLQKLVEVKNKKSSN